MKLENVLVTGGAGFIGSQLLLKLLDVSNKIYVIDDLSTGLRTSVPRHPKIAFIEGSITDKRILKDIMPRVQYVFHLACSNLLKSVEDLDMDFCTNLYGGYLLLKTAHRICPDLKRFIYASTASVYGDATVIPTTENYHQVRMPYAASKFSTEHYCEVFHHMQNMPVTVLRLSNVFGPGQTPSNPYCGVVAKLFDSVASNAPLTIYGDGKQTRDFTYIEDAIDAFFLAATNTKAIGQTYNVGTGVETSVIELAEKIMEITGSSGPVSYLPKRAVDIVERRGLDASRIQRELNWSINHSLSQGLAKTYQWLKEVNRK